MNRILKKALKVVVNIFIVFVIFFISGLVFTSIPNSEGISNSDVFNSKREVEDGKKELSSKKIELENILEEVNKVQVECAKLTGKLKK